LIMNFLVMPLFFLSGAIFPLTGAGVLGTIARFDPLSYSIDSLRCLLSNINNFGLGFDLLVLSIITLVFLGLGSYFFSKIQI